MKKFILVFIFFLTTTSYAASTDMVDIKEFSDAMRGFNNELIDEYEYDFLHFSWLFYVQRITKLGKSIDKNCISVNFLFTQPRKNCITIKKCVCVNNFCVYT